MVDALRLKDDFGTGNDLLKQNLEEDDIENLVIQQIEFCNIVLLNKASDVEPKELFSMYEKDDKKAVTIIERAAEVMARGVANITCMMDPDCIVVGGSIAINNPFFVDMIYRRALKYCIAPEKLRIEKALYGDDAGLIGAALLVKEKNNG